MKTQTHLKRERYYFRFFMLFAYATTFLFGLFYHFLNIPLLATYAFITFGLFIVISIVSLLSDSLVTLYRIALLITLLSICYQVFHTGGINSPALTELIVPPLLGFFYKPVRDRSMLMLMSAVAMISICLLSTFDLTQNLLPLTYQKTHALLCVSFVFTIICIYAVLFKTAVSYKNLKAENNIKRLQDATHKLVQSEKMASLGVLSAGVAHEINNPLNFIKGGADSLQTRLEADHEKYDSEYKECIDIIQEGVNRASTIINSLNHFSRQSDLMSEACDLNKILENSLVMLQPKLKDKGRVEMQLAATAPIIMGNEGKIHQVFINLIGNAADAIAEKGLITIKTKTYKKKVEVWIVDNGTGIPKEALLRVTDPFFTTKKAGEGTGLGLFITQNIVNEHQGDLKITSRINKGSKFVLSFPRFEEEEGTVY